MDIHAVDFPLVTQGSRLKRTLFRVAGEAMIPFSGSRIARLEAGEPGPGGLSVTDKCLLAALVPKHEAAGTPERLMKLHRWLWASDAVTGFHDQAEARFESWWIETHSRILGPVAGKVAACPGVYEELVEIGCGPGLVLADIARRLPQVPRLIGIDLSVRQIEATRARQAGGDPRLEFVAADAAEWIPANGKSGSIYVTSTGVLEYLSEADLRALLTTISRTLSPALFAISEPLGPDFDPETESRSRPYGPERSLAHPYPRVFTETGWRVLWRETATLDGVRFLMLVAETPGN